MRLPKSLVAWLHEWACRRVEAPLPEQGTGWWASARFAAGRLAAPDLVVGPLDDPYLLRWRVIPRNRFFNVHLHQFQRSDDDRALHDHPRASVSIILAGLGYYEHTTAGRRWRPSRSVICRRAKHAYRIELFGRQPVWTLLMTGPKVREWGLHRPQGWRHWRLCTKARSGGNGRGAGCE